MKNTKRNFKFSQKFEKPSEKFSLDKAIDFIKQHPSAKFDETVEAHFNLNLDQKKKEVVRGRVVFPKPFGRDKIILVFCSEDKADSLQKAGVKYAGGEEFIQRIKQDPKLLEKVDLVLAEPLIMREVAQLGKILGPKGLMPSQKSGTVREDLKQAVQEIKEGAVSFRSDETGSLHQAIGKMSFKRNELIDNFKVFLQAVIDARGDQYKKNFIRSITLCSTMGKGVKVEL